MRPWEREGKSTPAPMNGKRTSAYGPRQWAQHARHTSLPQDSHVQEEWDQKGSLPTLPFCSTDKPTEGHAGVGLGPCWRSSSAMHSWANSRHTSFQPFQRLSSLTFSIFSHHVSTVILEFNGLEVHRKVFSLEDIKLSFLNASECKSLDLSSTSQLLTRRPKPCHRSPAHVFQPQPGGR